MPEVTGCDSGRIFPRSLGPACMIQSHWLLGAGVEVKPQAASCTAADRDEAVSLPGNQHDQVDSTHQSYYAVVIRPADSIATFRSSPCRSR